jgi:hypothetical protein
MTSSRGDLEVLISIGLQIRLDQLSIDPNFSFIHMYVTCVLEYQS